MQDTDNNEGRSVWIETSFFSPQVSSFCRENASSGALVLLLLLLLGPSHVLHVEEVTQHLEETCTEQKKKKPQKPSNNVRIFFILSPCGDFPEVDEGGKEVEGGSGGSGGGGGGGGGRVVLVGVKAQRRKHGERREHGPAH